VNFRAKTFKSSRGIPCPAACVHPYALDSAFTLIELLVVVAIIGVLAAIGLPAMRGMTRSNAMIAANRQFLDDLAYARQRAIGDHTSVYVVFVPTNITQLTLPASDPKLLRQITNLYTGQYTTYALLSLRQLGDQPGVSVPKYLTGWRNLPAGVFISTVKFGNFIFPKQSLGPFYAVPPGVPAPTGLRFPVATNNPNLSLPCLTFNYLGQLVSPYPDPNNLAPGGDLAPDEYIPLARGSIFFDPTNHVADVQENPAGNSTNSSANVIYINALTGRAKILQQQLQ
jgi:prepilin-type N-terminal cleavage/methylation domain-containing protein